MTSCWPFEDKTQIDLLITSKVVNSLRNGLEGFATKWSKWGHNSD